MRKLAALVLLCGLALNAAVPLHQPLAELVPDGAIFAVGLVDAAAGWDRLCGTPLADAVWKGPLKRHLADTGKLAKIRAFVAKVEDYLGLAIGPTLRQLAGGEAILAAYPGDTPDKAKVGLFLRGLPGVDAASVLDGLVTRLVNAGELHPLDAVPLYDEALFKRFRNKDGEEFGILTYGNHTLIANATEIASGAGDLAAGVRSDSLYWNPRARAACEPLLAHSQLVAFFDVPRFLEAARPPLDQHFAQAPFITATIKAVKGVALGVGLRGDGLSSRLRIAVDEAALPDFVRAYLAAPAGFSAFAQNLPRNGIIAGLLAHFDLGAVVNGFIDLLPAEAKADLDRRLAGVDTFILGGRSLTRDLLPALGPDFALLVTDLDPSDRMPADLTLLVKINNPTGRDMLASLARSLYGLTTQFAPDPRAVAKHSPQEEGDTLILSSAQNDFTPCAIVGPSALIVGVSRAVAMQIKEWLAKPPAENLGADLPPFKTAILGADLERLGAWSSLHKAVIAAEIVKKKGIAPKAAEAEAATLGAFLAQFRVLAVTGRVEPGAFEVVGEVLMQ